MSIYNWADVPEEVKWIATDYTGHAYGYFDKPIEGDDLRWIGEWEWPNGDELFCLHAGINPFRGDWRESLEARPVHPCSGKCPRYQAEQCGTCLVGEVA